MNYLVTGGAGFVGSAVARQLLTTGNTVVVIDNISTGYRPNVPPNAIFIEGDCSNKSIIDRLLQYKFDAIFHIAGQSSGEISFDDPVYDIHCNTVSTLLLLQYAVTSGCKQFIYASTMSVYGDSLTEVVAETASTNPKSFYAVGKLASERYLQIYNQVYGINFTALRYFNIYGPGQNLENLRQGMVSIYLKQLISNDFDKIIVKGAPDRFRDFIFIDNVVEITLDCLRNTEMQNKVINIGTGVKTTVGEVIRLLIEKTGIKKEIDFQKGTPGDQFGIYADNQVLNSVRVNEYIEFSKGIELFVKSIGF